MNILITGGAGFVGANLIPTLAGAIKGKIRVLDNETLGRLEHIGLFEGEYLKGDIRDANLVDSCLEGIDAVVHLAADTSVVDSIENPSLNFDVNVNGTLTILEAMRRRKVKRLINASTGGAIAGHVSGPVSERMVAAPIAPYGASKLAVESYCSAYTACYGLSAVSLRFSNVFGPRSFHKDSVVAAFYKAILAGRPLTVYGDGTQIRDYVYVEDICDGIINALRCDVNGPIQLGSGKPTVLNDLIAIIRNVTGADFAVHHEPARVGEIHSTYCEVALAQSKIAFKPTQDLTAGLAKTWSWFLKQRHSVTNPSYGCRIAS